MWLTQYLDQMILYLGAGNYISPPGEKTHRLETIRYLYDLFTNELVGKFIFPHWRSITWI